jgi:hypothetical protein
MTARRKHFKPGMMARIMMMADQNRYRRGRIDFVINQDQLYIVIDGTSVLSARVPHKNVFREQGAG